MTRMIRPFLAVFVTLAALCGASACGSSSTTTSSNTTTAPGLIGVEGTTTTGDAASSTTDVDPCSLYSTADMAEQMGADDVTTTSSTIISPKCTYNSAAHYLKAELSVLDADRLASSPHDPQALLKQQPNVKAEALEVSGIGDEVWGYTMDGAVALYVGTGDGGYSLWLTNAGGGDDAGNWVDDAAMAKSAETILTAVVAANK